MRKIIREYGHLALMCVCLLCCTVLLGSVLLDRPLVEAAETHVPVLRTAAEGEHDPEAAVELTVETEGEETMSGTNTGYVLTEDFLEAQLAGFLPESFPATDIDVSFDNGLLELSFDISRADLKAYLEAQGAELGLSRTLLLQLLPRTLEADARFALSADENGLHLSPVSLELGDKAFSLTGLPQSTFSAIDQGLNALLQNAGVSFRSAEFTEDGILLQ